VTAASPSSLADDTLIELSRKSARQPLVRRYTTGLLAGSFVAAAALLAALPTHRSFSALALVVCMACYALASRVRFEFANVFALPTEAIFVAMWFLLPPRVIPLAVLGSLLAAELPDVLRGRTALDRLPLIAVCSWFSVGPALVIFAFAPGRPHWNLLPVYAAALAAQFAFDYASNFALARPVYSPSALGFLRGAVPSFAVDALLAPLGVLVSFATFDRPLALLFLLPTLALFARFADERQYRIDHALELSGAYRGTAMLLGDVIEADDEYTGHHSRDVVDLVLTVADRLGLDARERQRAEFAALLHDVGKIAVPNEIINKEGPLDEAEWEVMRQHTIEGERMLKRIGGVLAEVGRIVRASHEDYDGSGYPDGLAGEEIPIEARIVTCCDAFSAMTTTRSYRKAMGVEAAIAELRACAATQFDPEVVEVLVELIESGHV